jgi:hypothetical protein
MVVDISGYFQLLFEYIVFQNFDVGLGILAKF